jgi:hypothetical protein
LRESVTQVDSTNGLHHVRQVSRLDLTALGRALDRVADRHPVLGSRLEDRDGEPWIVTGSPTVALTRRDLSSAPSADRPALAAAATGDAIWTPFAVERGPLWRAFALRMAKDEFRWGFVAHHFIVDRVAFNVLVEEVSRAYAALELPPVGLSYEAYLLSLQAWLDSADGAGQRRFWVDHLGRLPRLDLPAADEAATPEREYFALDDALAQAVRTCARQLKTTVFIVLLAAQMLMLRPYATSTRVAVKIVTDGREAGVLRRVVGNLADRLYILVDLAACRDFAAVVRAVHEQYLTARRHAYVRFDIVQTDLTAAGLPVAAPVFNFHPLGHRAPEAGSAGASDPAGPLYPRAPARTRPDSASGPYWLEIHDRGDTLSGHVRHSADGAVPSLLRSLDRILRDGCGDPHHPLSGRVEAHADA